MKGFGVFLLVIGLICACMVNLYVGIGLAILGGILILVGAGERKSGWKPGETVYVPVRCPTHGGERGFATREETAEILPPDVSGFADINGTVTIRVETPCSVRNCGQLMQGKVTFAHPLQNKPPVFS